MTILRRQPARRLAPLLGIAAVLACGTIQAQTSTPYENRNVIVIDPAHGGQDSGPDLNGEPEKTVTLDLALSLKALLTARGFTVVSTRDADLPDTTPLLTADQRAGTANHLRPIACILIHATNAGRGVHLAISTLPPADASDALPSSGPPVWETAQTPYLPQSTRLANDLGRALLQAKIPVVLSKAALRPLDNLTCPAVAVEIAPLSNGGTKTTSLNDGSYQQRVAETIAGAVLAWRDLTAPRPAPKAAPAAGVTP